MKCRDPRALFSVSFNDAQHAAHAHSGGFYPHACHSAQQAVEKSLKALLLEAGQELERTHSIIALQRTLDEAGINIPASVLSAEEARLLTRMQIETRYPLGDADDAAV